MFLKDEKGQGAAEYILLFGAMIIVAVAALLIYGNYVRSLTPFNSANDINSVRTTSSLN